MENPRGIRPPPWGPGSSVGRRVGAWRAWRGQTYPAHAVGTAQWLAPRAGRSAGRPRDLRAGVLPRESQLSGSVFAGARGSGSGTEHDESVGHLPTGTGRVSHEQQARRAHGGKLKHNQKTRESPVRILRPGKAAPASASVVRRCPFAPRPREHGSRPRAQRLWPAGRLFSSGSDQLARAGGAARPSRR